MPETKREDFLDVLEALFGRRHPDFQHHTNTLEHIVDAVRRENWDGAKQLADDLLRFHAPHIGMACHAYNEWDDLSVERKRTVMDSLRSYEWAIEELSDALTYLQCHN